MQQGWGAGNADPPVGNRNPTERHSRVQPEVFLGNALAHLGRITFGHSSAVYGPGEPSSANGEAVTVVINSAMLVPTEAGKKPQEWTTTYSGDYLDNDWAEWTVTTQGWARTSW